ncbi:hypothetical protein PAHAL_5G472300 [Panicum hallii]|uniref:MADS-box domain-containing protein n=1 Tax=Panicum hallii TaxID=206008 RepID=A0A2T8INT2_9POAL|nr:MADS-box transcription factor 51-like [Panicum hallii]PVH39296.1 hypothetical protein PAHAL_5G472300 [Panicum hallii]
MAPRGRVQLRRFQDRLSRQVRFFKRRTGLFKKAFELSLLCDAEVVLLVFSPAGKLYEYSSSASIEHTYDGYQQFARARRNVNEASQNRNNNQDDASSDLKSRFREITTWSLQNNAKASDADELGKLEDLLRNALRDTKSKK